MQQMKNLFIFLLVCVGLISCYRSQSYYSDVINSAEEIMIDYPDSALSIIAIIDPTELTIDSLKAKYYYVRATAHDNQEYPDLSDSLVSFSVEFYRDKDLERSINSTTLLALNKYWMGENKAALQILDSLTLLENIPDSLLINPLRAKANISADLLRDNSGEETLRRLMDIDRDTGWNSQYKYWLYIDYLYNSKNDSALLVLDEIIDCFDEMSPARIKCEYEKIGVLEELGRYTESMNLIDKFLSDDSGLAPPAHYLYLWKSLCLFNMGRFDESVKALEIVDSLTEGIAESDKGYFNSFTFLIKTAFDYHRTGKLSPILMAKIINIRNGALLRNQVIQQETRHSALEIENKRLILKAKNDTKNLIIVIIILLALIITCALLWFARNRRRKELEAVERSEVLQELVDELNNPDAKLAQHEALRRAMLQQLGIIKLVAETPTEQNREMLRKISSIDSKHGDSIVNWDNVHDIIDNLYAGFYSGLHRHFGEVLTEKEEQIIVLMLAGFSTKEISVLTSQTTATIYVRKSAIRKKLGVPEKDDIIAFLRQKGSI